MALTRRRPHLAVYLPRRVLPGTSFEVRFELEAVRPVPIDYFDVLLTGDTFVALGNRDRYATLSPLALGARVAPAGELPQGKQTYTCRFTLPPDAAPTFDGHLVRRAYELRAHLSIPWWPDLRSSYVVVVGLPPPTTRSGEPLLYSSAPDGPKEREPHAEVSLASSELAAGETLRGAVALSNVEHARYTGIHVSLVGHEYAPSLERRGEFGRWEVDVPAKEFREAEPVEFSLRVPELPPSSSGGMFRVWWMVEVRVRRRLGKDLVLSLPITLVASSASESDVPRRAPPNVGKPRLEKVWNEVGRDVGMQLEDERLVARVEHVDVMVHREHLRAEAHLLGELSFEPLGLGLVGAVKSGLERVFGSDGVEIGHFRLRGHDGAQVQALADALRPLLAGFELQRLDDRRLVFALSGSGASREPVERVARAALEIARLLPRATRALPAPAAVDFAAWRALAALLDGALHPAPPKLTLERDGRAVTVEQRWHEGVPAGVEILLGQVVPESCAQMEGWPAGARSFALSSGLAGLELGTADGALRLMDSSGQFEPEKIAARLRDLVTLSELLVPRTAYR